MRVQCRTCPHTVHARDEEFGRQYLAAMHVCPNVPVDPDNDPRRPRDDAHAEQMERDRLGLNARSTR